MSKKEVKKANIALLYVPFPDMKEARKAAKILLKAKLIVCANIIQNVVSIYTYNRTEQESSEVIVLFKTKKEQIFSLKKKIEHMHSYEVPAIIEIRVDSINKSLSDYLLGG